MNRKSIRILTTVLAVCAMLALVDVLWQPGYAIRSGVKLALFLGGFVLCARREDREILQGLCSRESVKLALILGAGVFSVILLAWLLFRRFIDLETIAAGLLAGQNVTAGNFLWVALYISVVNSGLEELFFRGLAFVLLRRELGARTAALLSAAIFAVYHVSIIGAWFSWWVFGICMLGLFLGGLIFCALDRRGSLLPSWLAHGAANLAINTIGMVMFGLL